MDELVARAGRLGGSGAPGFAEKYAGMDERALRGAHGRLRAEMIARVSEITEERLVAGLTETVEPIEPGKWSVFDDTTPVAPGEPRFGNIQIQIGVHEQSARRVRIPRDEYADFYALAEEVAWLRGRL